METPFKNLAELAQFIQTDSEIKGGKNFKFPEDMFKDAKAETVFFIEGSGIVGSIQRTLKLGVRFNRDKGKPTPKPEDQKPGKLKEPQVIMVEEVIL